ncbi:MAG: hypothetical protein KDK74_15475 [Cephaloticoccus sp.]|nr:hypothetical protein [Cephaloticoccus sp.]
MPKESAEIPTGNENALSPAEQKRQDIIDTATRLFRELLASHYDELVEDAAEAFQNDETAEQPIAKIGFKVEFPPLHQAPGVVVKCAWTVSHKDEASQVVDPAQSKLPFDSLGEGETATISSGGKIIAKFTGSKKPEAS